MSLNIYKKWMDDAVLLNRWLALDSSPHNEPTQIRSSLKGIACDCAHPEIVCWLVDAHFRSFSLISLLRIAAVTNYRLTSLEAWRLLLTRWRHNNNKQLYRLAVCTIAP